MVSLPKNWTCELGTWTVVFMQLLKMPSIITLKVASVHVISMCFHMPQPTVLQPVTTKAATVQLFACQLSLST